MQRGLCFTAMAVALLAGCSANAANTPDTPSKLQPAPRDGAAVTGLVAPFGGPPRWGYSTPAPPPPLATTGNIDAALLAPNVVSDIVGTSVAFPKTSEAPEPPIPLSADSECSALLGLNSDSYRGPEKKGHTYTAYRRSHLQDSPDNPNYVVVQEIAAYPDAKAAETVFRGVFNDTVRGCNGATVQVTGDDDKTDWRLQVGKIADARAQWRAIRLTDGDLDGWSCAHNAQYKNNVVLAATVCKHDGGGVSAVAAIAKQMAATVPD